MRNKALTSKQLAKTAAGFAEDKKAQEVSILDMRGLVNFCDYFVVATGTSDRHVKAVAQGIEEELKELGVKTHHDPSDGAWALLDMGDVVVHVFEPQAREFYALEHLWQDAPKVKF